MNQDYVYPNIFMSQDDLDSINQYTTDIDNYVKRMKSDFVMNGNVEEKWDEYLKTLEGYGLSKYLELLQKNLDTYYAGLGE